MEGSASVPVPSPTLTLAGSYEFESSDNVDEYMKGLGVGLVLRKVQTVAKPHYEISQVPSTNQWKITVESPFKRRDIVFRPQEKFQDETFDSRECQSTVDVKENGKIMNWIQECQEGPSVESSMTATETGFTLAIKSGEFRCELKFRRAEPNAAPAPRNAIPLGDGLPRPPPPAQNDIQLMDNGIDVDIDSDDEDI